MSAVAVRGERPAEGPRPADPAGPAASPPDRRLSTAARLAPAALAGLLGAIYVIIAPRTGDLAAHYFRAELFEREGLTIWNGNWYGGHHTPAYSVLWPPLAALLGPTLVGALSATAAAAMFEPLARGHYGRRAGLGAAWFAAATATLLLTGRLPFALGVAIGLGALLALQRGRLALAAALGALCSLASPVAGLFLALAGTAHGLSSRRRGGLVLALFALAPAFAVAGAFPEGGYQPFAFSAFVPIAVLVVAVVALVPRTERALRVGAILYGVAALAAFLVDTPMGGNATRLGMLFGGPVLACVVLSRELGRRRVLAAAALLLGLAVWQWSPAVRATFPSHGDRSNKASYYEPLLAFLADQRRDFGRLEIPPTAGLWEAAEVAPHHPLARGWERQLDTLRNSLFYEGELTHARYARWLAENAVGFVALPVATLDYSAEDERALIEQDPPYLARRWESRYWRVYEVTIPHPLVLPEAGADIAPARLGRESLTLDVRRPGSALVRIRWSPYWSAPAGCVERAGDWTRVTANRPGRLRISIRFAPERVLVRGRRCG